MYIEGLFIVDQNFSFENATVKMAPGAEIVVQPHMTLSVFNTTMESCVDAMWKAITAQNGSMVLVKNSFLDDSEQGLTALNSAILWVDNTVFHGNRASISVPAIAGVDFNSVNVYVRNSTFYSAGAMAQPYPGQTTAVGAVGYAAIDANNMALDLTGGGNVIHDMSNGIVGHQCDISVNSFTMYDIQPDLAYAFPGNGSGIYARGDSGFFLLKQSGFGSTGAASFTNCRWSIYTEYMSVNSRDNYMDDVGTAYRIDRSGYRNVDIFANRVSTRYHGMELRSNDGAAHVLIENNEITFGDAPLCNPCRGYSAILVTEGNTMNLSSVIRNNAVRYVALTSSRFGINLYSADDWLVAENTLLMADNARNRTGIQLNGCARPEVSCNTVTGASNTYPVDAQAAIRNMMGSDVLISCNEMDSTANGILFNFVTPNADVRGNFFHNHKWALHLDSTAVIGTQTLRGNLWYDAAASGGVCALYEDTANAALNPFFYNPATINGGNTQPPSWAPSGWFNFSPGTNYDCADDEGEDYCSQFNERGKERLTALDEKVARDSLENEPFTDETKWILKGRLYKKLDDNPDLLDSLQVMDEFYDDLQGSTTTAFKAIDDDHFALYDLDSSVVAQLQQNRQQIETLMILVKEGLEQFEDSTFTTTQLQATLTSINGYREDIGDLSTWNASAIQAASNAKALGADDVRSVNAGITTSELIETNEKSVNDIYLATVAKNVDGFTATQASELFDIANQCPMLGGNAVFQARSLYWLIDEGYEFDDQLMCLPFGIIVKRLAEREGNAIRVVPNPAGDEATLVLDRALTDPGVFIVYDAIGAEVMQRTLPIETLRISFSTESLAPALYQYQVSDASGVIGNGKLTIVH